MHSERYFFAVQLPILQARNTAFGLTKLVAAACMQCTAQRQQKAANTSLLESRSLLQTATLVFPRPIICSRLSNNINILAKKLPGCQRGGGHAPLAPGWIRHCYLCLSCMLMLFVLWPQSWNKGLLTCLLIQCWIHCCNVECMPRTEVRIVWWIIK